MIKNLKGAIFDMDGTLIDSLMLWNVIWKKFGELFLGDDSFAPANEDDKAVRTMTLKEAMDFIHEKYNIAGSGEELLNTANEIIADFYSNEVMLKDGVGEVLEYLKAKGVKMCIASATSPDLISLAAKHCGIEDYFEFVLSCAQIGKGKDEPDIYLKAMDMLATSKEDTCVFEDSHIAIITADKLGIKTVGIYDKYNYGQDEIKRIATCYIAEGESIKRIIK